MSDCQIWTGSLDRYGYGRVSRGGVFIAAHRLAYAETFGPVPDGLEIDHLCRTRACVNPSHLEAVTHQINCQRRVSEPKTHCPHGHQMTPENTFVHIRKSGSRAGQPMRECRECKRESVRRSRLKVGEIRSLTESIKALTALKKNLEKEQIRVSA